MRLTFTNLDRRFASGVVEFGRQYGFEVGEGGLAVTLSQTGQPELGVQRRGNQVQIIMHKPVHLYRALGHLLQNINDENFQITEKDAFQTNGAMHDGSQASSLLNIDTCKKLLRMMAAMGLNLFMLYCEDCYDVEGEPYWGYMRPRYSQADFRELDDYAWSLGIEMIPCIQTLAHLTDAIQWRDYRSISDNECTLLVGDERVYELVEKLIRTASAPFRSRRIHLGLDEAWHIGQGNYLLKNGYRRPIDIMSEHIARLAAITRKLGLQPMMWGDMYFRAQSPTGSYYDESVTFTADFIREIPPDIQLVYWDYYHRYDTYNLFIDKYRALGQEPIFAGCSRNVRTFGSHHTKTVVTSSEALTACKEKGIQEVFATIWGDDHRESSVWAILPGLQLYAEYEYGDAPDETAIARRFNFCTGVDYQAIVGIKDFDQIPALNGDNYENSSPSKLLMWQDILLGLFDTVVADVDVSGHYVALGQEMAGYAAQYPDYRQLFEFYASLGETLAWKGNAGVRLTAAYRQGDQPALRTLAEETLPRLQTQLEQLRKAHRAHFFEIYKPVGWEILDIRYGGAIARCETARQRLTDYLAGKVDRLEELEEPRLAFDRIQGVPAGLNYSRICSASRL